MPPLTENSPAVRNAKRQIKNALVIRRLTEEHALLRQALETIYQQAHDFGDYWSHDVARDVLKKLRSAKNPDVHPVEPEGGG